LSSDDIRLTQLMTTKPESQCFVI